MKCLESASYSPIYGFAIVVVDSKQEVKFIENNHAKKINMNIFHLSSGIYKIRIRPEDVDFSFEIILNKTTFESI